MRASTSTLKHVSCNRATPRGGERKLEIFDASFRVGESKLRIERASHSTNIKKFTVRRFKEVFRVKAADSPITFGGKESNSNAYDLSGSVGLKKSYCN